MEGLREAVLEQLKTHFPNYPLIGLKLYSDRWAERKHTDIYAFSFNYEDEEYLVEIYRNGMVIVA